MSLGERVTLGVVMIVGVLLTVATMLLRDRTDAAACATRYAQAYTAADTARVDLQFPPMERGKGNYVQAATCGELRRQRGPQSF